MTVQYTDPFGPSWKFPWIRMMSHWEGSIFQFLLVEWLTAIFIYALFLLIWYMQLKDINEDLTPQKEALFKALGFKTSRFQAAISLMLGFYTTTIYSRWWRVRELEGVVIGRINDLSVQIAALIRDAPLGSVNQGSHEKVQRKVDDASMNKDGETMDDGSLDGTGATTAGEVRMNLVRWLNLAHALAIGDLYEKKPNEFSSLQNLLQLGLLSSHEYEYLKDNDRSRYTAPFIWFLNLLHELKDKGYCGISDGTLIIICGNITRVRGSLADLYMFRNVPMPLSYRQLVNWTVRVYMVIFAIGGTFESAMIDDGNLEGLQRPSVFLLLVPFAFEYFLFVGWLSLADALGNPFHSWADEFEYENYVKSVALSSNQSITKSRDASTPLDQIDSISPKIEQKQDDALSQWEHSTTKDHKTLRERLTGF